MSTLTSVPTMEPQIVRIRVDRGYRPAQSVAQANVPLRLVFQRRDAEHCTERVIFSSPHIERRLVANGTTVIDLPAQPPGVVRFTCGMGRYRGEIEIAGSRAAVPPRARIGIMLAAGAAVFALLVTTGTLQVEPAAGLAVLVGGAPAAFTFASRRVALRPSKQS